MVKSLTISTIKYVLIEILLDFIKFPLWWYSSGLANAAKKFLRHIKIGLKTTGLKVWAQNLFKPMFNETSFQGRIISFFMRLILLIFRTIAMLVWLTVSLIIFSLWLALPPFVIYMIARQLI